MNTDQMTGGEVRSKPAVSILMPVYNAGRYVASAVESMLGQTLGDFEFLIVDDGSTDGSRAVLEAYAARDSRIHLVSRHNTGMVIALNEMLGRARGELVARMDADDVARPTRLERQVALLKESPEVVLVGGSFEMIGPDGAKICRIEVPQGHEKIDAALLEGNCHAMLHPTCMMRTAAVRAIGGYRTELEIAEDIDLYLRMAETGRLANVSDVVLDYRVHLKSATHQKRRRSAELAAQVIQEARQRRGLPPYTPAPWPREVSSQLTETLRCWGWWALGGRNVATARRYAWQAWVRSPLSTESWKLLACSMRGR